MAADGGPPVLDKLNDYETEVDKCLEVVNLYKDKNEKCR